MNKQQTKAFNVAQQALLDLTLVARLARALQKIADLPLHVAELKGRPSRRDRDLRVRRIAISALKELKE